MSKACPYFPARYLDFLSGVSLHPKQQVKMAFNPKSTDEKLGEMGEIECWIEGVWTECILYEVPIMSICALPSFLPLIMFSQHPTTLTCPSPMLTSSERGVLQVRRHGLEL